MKGREGKREAGREAGRDKEREGESYDLDPPARFTHTS